MDKYQVTGMSCAACSAHVEKAVRAVDGVDEVAVSLEQHLRIRMEMHRMRVPMEGINPQIH